jgi:hypothetical protein
MTDLRTAALRALEALQTVFMPHHPAVIDLRSALAQPEDKSQAAFEHWVETVEATQGCAISRNAVADATVTPAQMEHAEAMQLATINHDYERGFVDGMNHQARSSVDRAVNAMAHADATCKQDLQVEPCNKSCAPGYCYCEPIIQPEIKGHNAKPEQATNFPEEKLQEIAEYIGEVLRQAARFGLVTLNFGTGEQTCNCRWVGDVQTQQCTLHESHVDAIHEWAERAKTAEEALRAKNSTLACIPAVPPG